MGEWSHIDLLKDKVYEVIGLGKNVPWYQIVDESGESYYYPPMLFEVIEN